MRISATQIREKDLFFRLVQKDTSVHHHRGFGIEMGGNLPGVNVETETGFGPM
jgi:hypothetical protein